MEMLWWETEQQKIIVLSDLVFNIIYYKGITSQ